MTDKCQGALEDSDELERKDRKMEVPIAIWLAIVLGKKINFYVVITTRRLTLWQGNKIAKGCTCKLMTDYIRKI